MAEPLKFDHLLVIPNLRVQNANAISSPLTHGFPSVTAFLGLMWALERKTRAADMDFRFNAVGVVCHDHQEQVTQGSFVNAFRLTRNPVGRDGSTAAIVEEGRIHLDISLVFAVQSEDWTMRSADMEEDCARVAEMLTSMRIAGGSVIPSSAPARRRAPYVIPLTGSESDQEDAFRRARMRLLPGFTLVSRDDLLEQRYAELRADDAATSRLDAWLSLARVNWHYQPPNEEQAETAGKWDHDRKGIGWAVPIPVGYGALGPVHEPGTVTNARDAHTPFRFVESLYSIGQWISPHRLETPRQMLWYADCEPERGLYRCRNDFQSAPRHAFDFD
ncbi:type I-F CRISPR-associated protein Csy2 [Flagellatimonas centrodinii]|uniref:type I-F CRISPR-associated protein Csy2 n=1 Tax=Flagellatimonas centrodinii TaxID=2806210 RepID=UPI001FEDEF5C|nr:type I-F CRISPR-associated protein Csy2 [Flagellatimonas centrodinii]ULQ48002.1 type I-F CRISPR-associated protein Csy2 [Flagellatimonas centrodinii]